MDQNPRPRISVKRKSEVENLRDFRDYTIDHSDQAYGKKYYPVAAYIGIIFAILLGAVIIALSIMLSSGRTPSFFSSSNTSNNSANINSDPGTVPAAVDLKLSPDYPMLGSSDAPVTMVEFADFQCPFCKEFQDKTFAQLKSKYIDTGIVKFYFVAFPFLGDESQFAAVAAECARQQDKFWEYHDLLYEKQGLENGGAFSDSVLKKLAVQLGLNSAKFATCQKDPKTADAIAQQFQAGQDAGVQATPSIFINGILNEGANPIATYQKAIEQAQKGQ
jgi:protein-disulfide isomerase